MTNAKQTAMAFYGLTEWPASHKRKHPFPECRGMACAILRRQGMSLERIALEVGFQGHKSVIDALFLRRVGKLKNMGHMAALVVCLKQLKGF